MLRRLPGIRGNARRKRILPQGKRGNVACLFRRFHRGVDENARSPHDHEEKEIFFGTSAKSVPDKRFNRARLQK
jgi:hypothetical protein